MPELPEVETVRAGLANHVIGATVKDIEVFDQRSLKRNFSGAKGFVEELIQKKLMGVIRRGKFLWLPISSSRALVCHLGMSGQVLVRSDGYEEDKLNRITLKLENPNGEKIEMRFVDQRLFGGMQIDDLVPTKDHGPAGFFPEGFPSSAIPISVAHLSLIHI